MIDKPLGGSIQSVRIREKELALMCEILYEHSTQRISVGGPGFAEGMSSSQLKSATSGHFTMVRHCPDPTDPPISSAQIQARGLKRVWPEYRQLIY